MRFLVLYRTGCRAAEYAYPDIKRLVFQHGAVGITRYRLVVNAGKAALPGASAGNEQEYK